MFRSGFRKENTAISTTAIPTAIWSKSKAADSLLTFLLLSLTAMGPHSSSCSEGRYAGVFLRSLRIHRRIGPIPLISVCL